MQLSEFDNEELIEELGLNLPVPKEIPRAWIIQYRNEKENTKNFDLEKFSENINGGWQKREYYLSVHGNEFKQIIATNSTLSNFVVLALSTDLLAGEASESFMGYFVLAHEEHENIKSQIYKLIKEKENGLHLAILWMLRQNFKEEKAYLNYFHEIKIVDFQDDGLIKFITPKRKLPKELRAALKSHLSYINWDESEYRCDAYTGDEYSGIMEVILLQDVFQNGNIKEKLAEINKIINEFRGD